MTITFKKHSKSRTNYWFCSKSRKVKALFIRVCSWNNIWRYHHQQWIWKLLSRPFPIQALLFPRITISTLQLPLPDIFFRTSWALTPASKIELKSTRRPDTSNAQQLIWVSHQNFTSHKLANFLRHINQCDANNGTDESTSQFSFTHVNKVREAHIKEPKTDRPK